MTYWQLCLLIWAVFTGACGWIAYSKDRSVGLWLFLGFLFGAFALLVIALLPDRQKFKFIEPSKPWTPIVEDPRPTTYGNCPECGRLAFSAADDGAYHCYACGKTVQVAT